MAILDTEPAVQDREGVKILDMIWYGYDTERNGYGSTCMHWMGLGGGLE